MSYLDSKTTTTTSRTNFPEDTTGFRDGSDGECTGLAVAGDPPMPGDDSAAALSAEPNDKADETGRPRLGRDEEIPEDFDYRELQPRRYGKSLPPLSDLERQNLKTSIIDHGFRGRILIDEWLNIIDGNTRFEICLELGIDPEVEIVWRLEDQEKEELALACNMDRRQLKDPDVERQVLQARFENLCLLRKNDSKKWPQQKIADLLGVSLATVSVWERNRHSSSDGTVSKPDSRKLYDENLKQEAVRLVDEGVSAADVSRMLSMSSKAVQRAVSQEKKRKSGTSAGKDGKSKKASVDSASQSTLEPNDGIPRIHRLALEALGQEPRDYAGRLEASLAKARETVEAASADVDELINLALYGSRLAAAADLRLRQILKGDEDGAEEVAPDDTASDTDPHEVGTVHIGSVLGVDSDGVYVALDGAAGVIDIGDMSLIVNTRPDEGDTIRVRVKGFDPGSGLLELALQGRQTFAQADRTTAIGPQSDDRCSPDVELSGRKAGPQEKEVI